jgi:hypothetical protein
MQPYRADFLHTRLARFIDGCGALGVMHRRHERDAVTMAPANDRAARAAHHGRYDARCGAGVDKLN